MLVLNKQNYDRIIGILYKERKMKCPMKLANPELGNRLNECEKEECAWWLGSSCAPWSIANSLYEIVILLRTSK